MTKPKKSGVRSQEAESAASGQQHQNQKQISRFARNDKATTEGGGATQPRPQQQQLVRHRRIYDPPRQVCDTLAISTWLNLERHPNQ